MEKRGKEVVLILHGDGGVPGSVAARGFLKREMVGKGRKGRVVAMLYMNAWALPAGVSKADFVRENPGWKRDWLRVEVSDRVPLLLYSSAHNVILTRAPKIAMHRNGMHQFLY